MKKTLILAWATCVLFATSTLAQTSGIPAPYGIDDAVVLDTVTQSLEISASGKKATLVITTMIWGRTSGAVELTFDAGEVAFGGDVEILAPWTTDEIYDFIALGIVDDGLAQGYVPCPSSGVATTGVTHASCVTRTGASFDVAGASLVRRAYDYACSGSRTIAMTGTTGTTSCASGEPTVGTSSLQ